MIKIVQKEDKILRQSVKEVPLKEIPSDKIKKIIANMRKALFSQEDGVAIAAPQIGATIRIFIVSAKIFNQNSKKSGPENQKGYSSKKHLDLVFINPKIIKISKKKNFMLEGCLSVRWLYGEVKRSSNVTIEAYDETGKKFTRGAGGLLAQIFQHEIDHLNGVLFIDKAKNLVEIKPEKNDKK